METSGVVLPDVPNKHKYELNYFFLSISLALVKEKILKLWIWLHKIVKN